MEAERRALERLVADYTASSGDDADSDSASDDAWVAPADAGAYDAHGEHVTDTINGKPNSSRSRYAGRRRAACPACMSALRRALPSESSRPRTGQIALTLRMSPRLPRDSEPWTTAMPEPP